MIGIVIPTHNEADYSPTGLEAIQQSIQLLHRSHDREVLC